MNGNPLVSIIVPMYNVEQYLEKCINSILQQTYTNWELWLIDDGSPDKCGEIAETYAANDERIFVVHKENEGVSIARNIALDKVRGEYIAFVDSDDYVEKNYLEVLLEHMSCDTIVCCGFNLAYEDMTTISRTFSKEQKMDFEGFVELLLKHELGLNPGGNFIGNYMWNKMYHRKWFEGIRFPEKVRIQDMRIAVKVYKKVNNFIILPYALYNYLQRDGSAVHVKSKKRDFEYLEARLEQERDLLEYSNLLPLAKRLVLAACEQTLYKQYLESQFLLDENERAYIRTLISERI